MKVNLEKAVEERKKVGEKLLPIFYSYREKRKASLKKIDREEMIKSLRELKENCLKNMEKLKKSAIKSLEKNGIIVIEAKNSVEVTKALKKIIGSEKLIVKSKSNTFNELDLAEAFKGKEVVETDLGDFLVQIAQIEGIHPVFPALELTPEKIAEVLKKSLGAEVRPDSKEIVDFVRGCLREKIRGAKIGITGANVITADGSIVIIENEGNISLVSRLPDKHIIVSSFDKIVPTLEDALKVVKCAAVYGSGQGYPVYVSIISGPSKTADIQNELVTGAQGAKEVYLILIDNCRSKILDSDYKELLHCINCGACLNFCPVYHQIQNLYGSSYSGPKGVVFARFQEGLKKAKEAGAFYCTGCGACKENCPAGIDLPELVRKVREELSKAGLAPEGTKKAMKNIKEFGNSMGEAKDAISADDWQCC